MRTFDYKDSFVAVREWESGHLRDDMQRTCFCCGKKINNCRAVLLINNSRYIPNVMLHAACFKEHENGLEELCDNIRSSYLQYKELHAIFG